MCDVGNDFLHKLTTMNARSYNLRVDLQDFDNIAVYAEYSGFEVESESEKYLMDFTAFVGGNAGNPARRALYIVSQVTRARPRLY